MQRRLAQLTALTMAQATQNINGTSELFPVLWDDNSIDPAALVAIGLRPNVRQAVAPNTIVDWPCQDAPADYCQKPFGSYCLRGLWPIFNSKGVQNGGVPQNASLSAHLAEIRRTMPLGVAENFTGIVAIDFEDWAPIWSEDTSKDSWHSAVYQNLSISLVLQEERPSHQAKSKAKVAFESAALEFFVETIKLCRALRLSPLGNMVSKLSRSMAIKCNGRRCGAERSVATIWDESVLLPSIYLAKWNAPSDILAKMNAAQIKCHVRCASRTRRSTIQKSGRSCTHTTTLDCKHHAHSQRCLCICRLSLYSRCDGTGGLGRSKLQKSQNPWDSRAISEVLQKCARPDDR